MDKQCIEMIFAQSNIFDFSKLREMLSDFLNIKMIPLQKLELIDAKLFIYINLHGNSFSFNGKIVDENLSFFLE